MNTIKEFDLKNSSIDHDLIIEASAGTGKTYTLENLFIRFLTEKNIPLNQILVITFTEKATIELKERIQNKIIEGINHASNDNRTELGSLSIFTIHGLCHKSLGENPLISQTTMNPEIVDTLSILKEQIREFFLLQKKDSSFIHLLDHFKNMQNITHFMNDLTTKGYIQALKGNQQSTHEFIKIVNEYNQNNDLDQKISHHQSIYLDKLNQFLAIDFNCSNLFEEFSQLPLKKNIYKTETVKKLFNQVKGLHTSTQFDDIISLKKLHLDSIENAMKKNSTYEYSLALKTFFQKISELIDVSEKIKIVDSQIKEIQLLNSILEFIHQIDKKCRISKISKNLTTFDDMITNTYNAVISSKNHQFVQNLRDQYKVCLLDEAQDTDHFQWQIIKTIFADSKDHRLIMVGDPKQSIYRFRGADPYVYLEAKNEISNHHHLKTNYRSSLNMNKAINTLMGFKSLFSTESLISFYPVSSSASKTNDSLIINGTPSRPFTFFVSDQKLKKNDYHSKLSQQMIDEIKKLFELKASVKIDNEESPVIYQDICVLCKTNDECSWVQNEFTKHQIPSMISKTSSLFSTQEAREVYSLLNYLNNPKDIQFKNSSLMTPFFNYSLNDLGQIDQLNPATFSKDLDLLTPLIQNGQFIDAFKYFIEHKNLKQTLINLGRHSSFDDYQQIFYKIFDFHHKESHSVKFTLLKLNQWIYDPEYIETTTSVVESLTDSISIMTIHASKGLGFPIVFLFGSLFTYPDTSKLNYYSFHKNNMIHIDLLKQSENLDLFLKEEEEDLKRQLYVALTRAKVKIYCPLIPPQTKNSKLLFHFLWSDPFDLNECKNFVGTQNNLFEIIPLNSESKEDKISANNQTPQEDQNDHIDDTPPIQLTMEQPNISSYTQIIQKMDDDIHSQTVEHIDEPIFPPKGAKTGTMIHDLLEKIDFSIFKNHQSIEEFKNDSLFFNSFNDFFNNGINDTDFKDYPSELFLDFFWNIYKASVPFNNTYFQLEQIEKKIHELEFLLHVKETTLLDIDLQLNNDHFYQKQINIPKGFYKGFIDLIFEYNGQYFIADWKTNFLGHQKTDYSNKNILCSMNEHHYHIQYLTYILALYPYLEDKIQNFSYEQHFGGIYYFYLRGMEAGSDQNGIFYYKPEFELINNLKKKLDHQYD